jgi:hypothetical protein
MPDDDGCAQDSAGLVRLRSSSYLGARGMISHLQLYAAVCSSDVSF